MKKSVSLLKTFNVDLKPMKTRYSTGEKCHKEGYWR